jgi:hypothetical protein
MERLTPFAQMPATPEPIIAQIRRQLADDVPPVLAGQTAVLDRVAERAVLELWGRPVKTFVPILALRQAREILRDQDLLITTESEPRPDDASPAVTYQDEGPGRDVLSVSGDVLPHDDRDVLHADWDVLSV